MQLLMRIHCAAGPPNTRPNVTALQGSTCGYCILHICSTVTNQPFIPKYPYHVTNHIHSCNRLLSGAVLQCLPIHYSWRPAPQLAQQGQSHAGCVRRVRPIIIHTP